MSLSISRHGLPGMLVTIVSCLMIACGSATVSGQREVGAPPQTRPAAVYVTDFQLDAQNLRSESGPPLPPPPPGPLGAILPPPPGAPKDPAVRARELIELMSTSLVQDQGRLECAETPGRRLAARRRMAHLRNIHAGRRGQSASPRGDRQGARRRHHAES